MRLKQVYPNEFELYENGTIVCMDNLKGTVNYMQERGFALGDIKDGLEALQKNGHTQAEYGIFKRFIFSE